MAAWNSNWTNIIQINNNNQFTDNDVLYSTTVNAIVNNIGWLKNKATELENNLNINKYTVVNGTFANVSSFNDLRVLCIDLITNNNIIGLKVFENIQYVAGDIGNKEIILLQVRQTDSSTTVYFRRTNLNSYTFTASDFEEQRPKLNNIYYSYLRVNN